MMWIFVFVVVGFLFYHYKKARSKQVELRNKARYDYESIVLSIELWIADKENVEKEQLAHIALDLYENWRRKAVFSTNPSAESFEVLSEWRQILAEEETAIKDWLKDGIRYQRVQSIREAMVELHERRK